MKRLLIFALFWFAASALPVFGETSEVVLEDGSTIHAEVISLENGNYTMRSESMGTFKLDAANVRRISSHKDDQIPAPAVALAGPSPDALKASVEDAQAAIMADPESMRMVTSLADDPDFKEFLADPQAVAALKSGDMEALKNNPKFMALIQNPKMQGVAARLMQKSK